MDAAAAEQCRPARRARRPFSLSVDESSPLWLPRLPLHIALASAPILGISAAVFGVMNLETLALVLLATLVCLLLLVFWRPHPGDRLLLRGLVWGIVACAAYDAFRLPTIYGVHLWNDFFGSVGGWATGSPSNFLVGYIWRYVGDGGGLAVVFFAAAATLGLAAGGKRTVIAVAVLYAICPVWSGLVLTDLLAPHGHALFPLTAMTLLLSYVGHLVYGTVLGYGYWRSRGLEDHWPLRVRVAQIAADG